MLFLCLPLRVLLLLVLLCLFRLALEEFWMEAVQHAEEKQQQQQQELTSVMWMMTTTTTSERVAENPYRTIRATSQRHVMTPKLQHHYNNNIRAYSNNIEDSMNDVTNPKTKQQVLLNDFAEMGGLIFFSHIPKTGGTTIRRNIEKLHNVQYILARSLEECVNTLPLVEQFIQDKNKSTRYLLKERMSQGNTPTNDDIDQINNDKPKTLFYEIHADDSPSFYEVKNKLKRWKDMAEFPVFYFTMIRDPVAFAISYFNFYHVQYRNPGFRQCNNVTEENFLRYSLWNPQCQFLFHGATSLRDQKPELQPPPPPQPKMSSTTLGSRSMMKNSIIITPQQCKHVVDQMWEIFDWVGTTERLSVDTQPLLKRLLNVPDLEFDKYKVSKQLSIERGEATFGMENITNASTIKTLLEMSSLDTWLYQRVTRRFTMDMWDN